MSHSLLPSQSRFRKTPKRNSSFSFLAGLIIFGSLLVGNRSLSQSPASHNIKKVTPPTGISANALAREMIRAYHNLNTLNEVTEAKILVVSVAGKKEFVQSGSFLFKRPYYLTMTTSDPDVGTFTVQCDGKVFVVYSAKTSVYARRNAASTFAETVTNFQKVAREEMGFDNTQILSPLSFLLAEGMPREATSFRYVGLEVSDPLTGRKAHHIKAIAAPTVLRELTNNGVVKPVRQNLDLWIDPKTHLATRVKCELAFYQVMRDANGKQKQVAQILVFDEVKKSQQINVPTDDKQFRFDPPKGSTLKYQQRRL